MQKLSILAVMLLLALLCLGVPARGEAVEQKQTAKTTEERRREREEERRQKREEQYREREEKRKKEQKPQEETKPTPQQEELKAAEALLNKGDMNGAYRAFASLGEQKNDDAVAKAAAEHAKKLVSQGEDEVKKILSIADPVEAQKKLNSIYATWWRTPVKDAMAEARQQLRVRAAQLKAQAGAAPADEAGGADGGAGEGADGGAEEGATPESKFSPEETARMWVLVGDIHRANGRLSKAADSYNVVIYDYPDSRFAQEARYRLDELRIEKDADAAGGEE